MEMETQHLTSPQTLGLDMVRSMRKLLLQKHHAMMHLVVLFPSHEQNLQAVLYQQLTTQYLPQLQILGTEQHYQEQW